MFKERNEYKLRELYYFHRRTMANIVAESNENKANRDSRYLQLSKTKKILMLNYSRAEANGEIEKAIAYKQELEQCERQIESVLKEIGLSLDDIKPKIVCEKCLDRGYVNRKPCDCYPGK